MPCDRDSYPTATAFLVDVRATKKRRHREHIFELNCDRNSCLPATALLAYIRPQRRGDTENTFLNGLRRHFLSRCVGTACLRTGRREEETQRPLSKCPATAILIPLRRHFLSTYEPQREEDTENTFLNSTATAILVSLRRHCLPTYGHREEETRRTPF